MRSFFRLLNRFFMVPVFRLGLGPIFGNPFSGYIMVLKTLGRKSGKTRFSPVNYAIHNGSVYCLAGFGRVSDWYRNLQFAPQIELIMPGGALSGRCETVSDPEERRTIVRRILKNAGFAGFFEGYNPYTISDAELAVKTANLPVVRIQPTGLGSGASDPGGLAWVAGLALAALILVLALRP